MGSRKNCRRSFKRIHRYKKDFYITGSGVVGVCKAIKNAKKDKEIKVIANDFIEENIYWLLDGTINF